MSTSATATATSPPSAPGWNQSSFKSSNGGQSERRRLRRLVSLVLSSDLRLTPKCQLGPILLRLRLPPIRRATLRRAPVRRPLRVEEEPEEVRAREARRRAFPHFIPLHICRTSRRSPREIEPPVRASRMPCESRSGSHSWAVAQEASER